LPKIIPKTVGVLDSVYFHPASLFKNASEIYLISFHWGAAGRWLAGRLSDCCYCDVTEMY